MQNILHIFLVMDNILIQWFLAGGVCSALMESILIRCVCVCVLLSLSLSSPRSWCLIVNCSERKIKHKHRVAIQGQVSYLQFFGEVELLNASIFSQHHMKDFKTWTAQERTFFLPPLILPVSHSASMQLLSALPFGPCIMRVVDCNIALPTKEAGINASLVLRFLPLVSCTHLLIHIISFYSLHVRYAVCNTSCSDFHISPTDIFTFKAFLSFTFKKTMS